MVINALCWNSARSGQLLHQRSGSPGNLNKYEFEEHHGGVLDSSFLFGGQRGEFAHHTPLPGLVPSPTQRGDGSTALAGKVIGIDPGHNGNNWAHPEIINALVPDGVGQKACDTTGTASYGGYSEAAFTWAVSQYLAADLAAEGAKVAMTRGSNDGVGPCVDQRAAMVNQAGAAVAVSIHADGGPDSGRGFAVLEPSGAGPSGPIVGSSAQLGQDIAAAIQAAGMPPSSYDGVNGIAQRSDLAGLNLATQPKVMVEVGNMRNSVDAAMLADPGFQQAVAKAVAQAITNFIGG